MTETDRASRLHSRYNPRAEAERYIETLGIDDSVRYCILIEPGLGYLAESIQKRSGGCKIVALHADSSLRNQLQEAAGIPAWFPDSPETAQGFLDREIPDSPAAAIRIVEWRPALNIYGKAYIEIFSEAADFVKRADAAFRTARNFGGRWIRNFFKNLAYIKTILLYRPSDTPVIVTGSGPGLEETLPRIRKLADRAFVLAASSSAAALRAGGINADLLISTDGGSWALSHLYCCFRVTPEVTGIAANLCAVLPSQSAERPLLILNDGSLWQTLVLNELEIPSVIVPQRGTVSASAVELSLILSGADIYLAGIDLSVSGIRTHARPYGFDYLFYGAANRVRPLYSQYFSRAWDTTGGGSLDVYAAWFRDRLKSWPKRIFSLDKKNTVFAPAPAEVKGGPREKFLTEETLTGNSACYPERALAVLFRALDTPDLAGTLSKELGALLFPGDPCPGVEEIKRELANCAKCPEDKNREQRFF